MMMDRSVHLVIVVLLLGYQRELTYQHDDGSFSAFGNSDPSGSMWLVLLMLDVHIITYNIVALIL